MAVSAMSLASLHAATQQAVQLLSHHKRGGRHSLADVDAAGSSVASAPTKTGKIASKVDISA
jgi:hypothetical protein